MIWFPLGMSTVPALPVFSGPSGGGHKVVVGKKRWRREILLRVAHANLIRVNEEGKRKEIIDEFLKGMIDVLGERHILKDAVCGSERVMAGRICGKCGVETCIGPGLIAIFGW